MKKLFLVFGAATMLFSSCATKKESTNSKGSVAFPGMTVTRSDYKLSKDVSAEVEIKTWTALAGLLSDSKAVGEQKREKRYGNVFGLALSDAEKIAVYRLLDANPNFDYLTNVRFTKEWTHKNFYIFHKYNTKIKVVAKGITLNTEK
jgi:hypothetical protein